MVDTHTLKEEQRKLAEKVSIVDSQKKFATLGGAIQVAYNDTLISAVVVCDAKTFEVLEKVHVVGKAPLAYIRGFLFYREGPGIMEAYNTLEKKPEVLMVKGNGILHQRRLGMASQVGVLLDTATIGIAASLLLGEVKDKTVYVDNEPRGYEVFTKEHAKPIYVSPGHNISLKTSQELVKGCIKYPHKLPEPLHQAHKYANKVKKSLKDAKES